eukprot:CAMPEP_0182545318 /NCGR_PEP_ID=MMETSP1323-20130603/34385_1 /TAXON_ID=236787 /ORGANISM="Florenciella parvula, Strain RCC1693" /LENGTH=164 /DNA_ID=CAMNT_0024756459 /DNA_START=95 /DNA_END=589 /DNA_ORIENTATION=+
MSRILSSIKFHKNQSTVMAMEWARTDTPYGAAPVSSGSPVVDNFFVRILSGSSTYFKPLGAVTAHDLEAAKAVLNLFDVVLILEQLNESIVQLAAVLGWTTFLGASAASTPHRVYKIYGARTRFTASQIRELRELNVYDRALYDHARLRSGELSARARSGQFAA